MYCQALSISHGCQIQVLSACRSAAKQALCGHRWAAFPPRPQKLQELFRLGYDDTFAWLKDNGKLTPGLLLDSALASQQNGSVLNGCSRQTAAPGQKPRWHNLVAQTAMEAPSCDESLKDVMAGKLPAALAFQAA